MDLRRFVEARRDRLGELNVAYDVSQALEECYAVSIAVDENLACRGFEGQRIRPEEVLALLRFAAEGGEPRARARMLLMRDIGAPKDDAVEELPTLLASLDAGVVRDVGAFLARGETDVRLGGEETPATVAVLAWELAACDLSYACEPDYEVALNLTEPPEAMAMARRLRSGIVRALRAGDWRWLGLVAG